MTRGGGTYGAGADDGGFDLEVIDLEPAEPAEPRRDTTTATGVRRRRAPLVIAIVVVTALVGAAIVDRSQRSSRTAASTSTTLAEQTDDTPLFPFRVGAQILTGGAIGLRLVDTDTGRVTSPRIKGLPPGPVTIVARSGGTIAVRTGAHLYWFSMRDRLVRSAEPTIDSEKGTVVFPAARRGFLWLAGPGFATQVPGPRGGIPTRGQAVGATRGGLLVVTEAGVLLQPTEPIDDSRLLLRAPATVIGVHPDRVAWVSNECGVLRCTVHVTEIATGATSSWLQLVGRPSPLVVAGTSAVFSPAGNSLAIVVPDANVKSTQTLVVADLRSRETTIVDALGRFDQPARPGSADATGITVDWTLDGRYVLLAPASGTTGPAGIVDPGTPLILSSGRPMTIGATAAVIGVSADGPLDLARHGATGPIDTGGPTQLGAPGLRLVGADDQQVDVLDLGDNRMRTWPVGGVVPNPAGPQTIARVTGGWLVVRGGTVDLLTDGGDTSRAGLVDAGSLVFSSNGGRNAWIAISRGASYYDVQSYDPATGALATVPRLGVPVGAVDDGLVVTRRSGLNTEIAVLDNSGRVRHRTVVFSPAVHVLATGGSNVAYSVSSAGLNVIDFATGVSREITADLVDSASLSPDGSALAWVAGNRGGPTAVAMRVDSTEIVQLGGPADRVLVADDGTVLFTSGVNVRRGRVDANGSTAVFGLAPDPAATLALG